MDSINLLFSGDFAPLISPKEIKDDHFRELAELFSSADLHITNLECPLTCSQKPIEKTGPSVKADPVTIDLLRQAKVDVVCLANNHIFDYGEEGINDTIKLCENNNVETVGIVSRGDARNHWLIKELKGKKIGILNYCEHEFSVREKGLLGASGYDPINAYYDVMYLRPTVDYLIVIYHGGNEYNHLPRPSLKKDFHYLADLGADAVIGHHSHVVSGYEIYKGKPLVYSLGNFFFPLPGEPDEWYNGMLCSLKLECNVEMTLHPFLQCQNGLSVKNLNESEARSRTDIIEKLSGTIKDDFDLMNNWNEFVNTSGKGLANFVLYSSRVERFIMRLSVFSKRANKFRRMRLISNIIRCRSLSELVTNYYRIR